MEKKKILIFLAFCFGISWLSAGIFYLCGIDYQSVWGFLFATVYMFFPLISVLLTQLVTGEKPLSDIGISFRLNKWWWLGWLVIIPLPILLSIPVSALFPGVSIGADTDSLKQTMDAMQAQGLSLGPWGVGIITLLSGFVAGLTINALFAFGEESAWRGFLHRLLKGKGFWKECLIIGVIWGIWHAPIILMGHNYPSHPVAGVFMMVAFCMLVTPLMVFIRERSGSVIMAAIAHGTINALGGLPIVYLIGYKELLSGITGLAGFIVLALADTVILLLNNKRKTA
ncbi:MAG: CPBP family intramembrane metalloprotease [Bacteroidales bacterium]|nr:CPBP family intramembrane metalloprotease [Bacteroidales bacterium]